MDAIERVARATVKILADDKQSVRGQGVLVLALLLVVGFIASCWRPPVEDAAWDASR